MTKPAISGGRLPARAGRRKLPRLLLASCLTMTVGVPAVFAADSPPAAILQELRSFREMSTVLHVAAHPDDENTQLITSLARGRGSRTAYLSVTRGDGGQNVIGGEFGEELGVIRTQELLAARRLDGGRQYFTRAIDFGFSKDNQDTINVWGRQQVVGDIVRIIRTFRPDVIITGFSPQAGGTHGHHTASAVLAIDAFKVAGDPKAFPEQLGQLTPWQPRRILQSSRGGRGGATPTAGPRLEVGGNDPVSGEPFSSIAGRSRAMHKSQGFGNFGGGGGGGGSRLDSYILLGGEPATNDIFEGVDTTWNRVPGGAEVGRLTDEAITKFNTNDPTASVPALLAIKSLAAKLPADPVVNDKRDQLDRILQACLGLTVETTIPSAEVVPGETLKLHHTVTVRSSVPVTWAGMRYTGYPGTTPGTKGEVRAPIELRPDQTATRDTTRDIGTNAPLTQPYWLVQEHPPGLYSVNDPSLIGQPENRPIYPVHHVFEVGGQTLIVPDEPVAVASDRRRRMDVIAPVALRFASEVRVFAPGSTRPVEVEVEAARGNTGGTLKLAVPADWKVEPASRSFKLASGGDKTKLSFNVTAPAKPARGAITAEAEVNGVKFNNGRTEIRYDHIPVQVLQPTARLKTVSLDLAIRGRTVGYLPGAGDSVAECIEQMGYVVKPLTGADLTAEKLRGLDAVVVGIRALNVRTDLGTNMPALFAFAENGGTVIVQYNRPDGIKVPNIAPFSLRLSGERITDENAAMTFLAPEHPVLNTPNKITSADFEGWVQERGIYFPNQWGEEFTPILACNDPGEAPKQGGLLIAKSGKGYFVYTGLVWFRELPDGVPGAYRLFANLLSLGK